MNFQLGEKVIVQNYPQAEVNGTAGEIIEINPDGLWPYYVRLDETFEGLRDFRLSNRELYSAPVEVFAVGDRVRVVNAELDSGHLLGEMGTVTVADADDVWPYRVKMDVKDSGNAFGGPLFAGSELELVERASHDSANFQPGDRVRLVSNLESLEFWNTFGTVRKVCEDETFPIIVQPDGESYEITMSAIEMELISRPEPTGCTHAGYPDWCDASCEDASAPYSIGAAFRDPQADTEGALHEAHATIRDLEDRAERLKQEKDRDERHHQQEYDALSKAYDESERLLDEWKSRAVNAESSLNATFKEYDELEDDRDELKDHLERAQEEIRGWINSAQEFEEQFYQMWNRADSAEQELKHVQQQFRDYKVAHPENEHQVDYWMECAKKYQDSVQRQQVHIEDIQAQLKNKNDELTKLRSDHVGDVIETYRTERINWMVEAHETERKLEELKKALLALSNT